jgi:hypothetical protein
MEWTETGEVLARFLQLHRFANHLGDVDPVFDFLYFIHYWSAITRSARRKMGGDYRLAPMGLQS